MHKIKLLLFIVIFACLLSINAFAHVTLLYPVGGETFQAGETVTIQWQIAIYHGPCNWDLQFSNDGGASWQSIVSDLPESALSYNWTVPNVQTDSAQVKVTQDNNTGMDYSDASNNFTINTTTGIQESINYAESFLLYPAYPNPFNPTTTIRYDLSEGSQISLAIYDVRGAKIKTLVDGFQSPGEKSVKWDGRNERGNIVSSGVYIYRLQAGDDVKMNKMTFLK